MIRRRGDCGERNCVAVAATTFPVLLWGGSRRLRGTRQQLVRSTGTQKATTTAAHVSRNTHKHTRGRCDTHWRRRRGGLWLGAAPEAQLSKTTHPLQHGRALLSSAARLRASALAGSGRMARTSSAPCVSGRESRTLGQKRNDVSYLGQRPPTLPQEEWRARRERRKASVREMRKRRKRPADGERRRRRRRSSATGRQRSKRNKWQDARNKEGEEKKKTDPHQTAQTRSLIRSRS